MDRHKLLGILIILMFVGLGLGLFNLNVIQGRKYKKLSNSNCIRLIPQFGCRGNILDRQGELIVGNKISYDVLILPQDLSSLGRVLGIVAQVLGVNQEKLWKAFKSGYLCSSMPVTIASNIDVKEAILLGEYKVNEPSIIIQSKPLRDYPYSTLASHLIGYLNEIDRWRLTKLEDYGYKTKDIVGFGGVEEKYDYYLRQEEGGLSVEVNHQGNFTRVLGFELPKNGKDIQLTIDLAVQKSAESYLNGKKGCVIIMDPNNGEIIALASFPNFDPGVFIRRSTNRIAELFNSQQAPMINRAISAAYPPASVFKVIVAAAGLELKKINTWDTIVCPGYLYVGKRKFSCWETHGRQGLKEALAHSCDTFFYHAGLATGAQNIYNYALKFGMAKPSNFELAYEVGGFIPSPIWRKLNRFQNWYDGDTANLSIGQGDCLVTPMQLVNMMAVFANGGYLCTPYVVKSIGGFDVSAHKRRLINLRLKKNTLNQIRQGLREVVSDPQGTGSVLASLSVPVAGKTGTAQVTRGQTHAWFVGFFPFEKPQYVICVFLENGGPGHAASVIAKQVIESMIAQEAK
ncbi:MAG: penicillin-binding protein 2 [Candidatus Omnitrophica bacterium]|jgi:penicillin-binding protein 2|nr:penicillin-binding protein 2 [Candidatus Omnitrophota bacterium]